MCVPLKFLLTFLLFNQALSQDNLAYQDYSLVTDFSQDTCVALDTGAGSAFYYYIYKPENVVPSCKQYLTKYSDVTCNLKLPQLACPPGYDCERKCVGSKSHGEPCETTADCRVFDPRGQCKTICSPSGDSCMIYHANTQDYAKTYYTAQYFKPSCLIDGSWAPKQCKGGTTGRCFCYDAQGARIFGQASYKEAKDMTCACSRRKADLLASGRWYVSFHCDSLGNYEEFQCDSGLCWCVEPKTGKLTSQMVPESNKKRLPCYNVDKEGNQYYRICDSALYAIEKITKEFKTHGVTEPNFNPVVCDGDGAAGPYTVTAGKAYCTWRDGTIITQSDISQIDIKDLNCNCARDTKVGLTTLTCGGSGNYDPLQKSAKGTFCVDPDGFQKSGYLDTTKQIDCGTYY